MNRVFGNEKYISNHPDAVCVINFSKTTSIFWMSSNNENIQFQKIEPLHHLKLKQGRKASRPGDSKQTLISCMSHALALGLTK